MRRRALRVMRPAREKKRWRSNWLGKRYVPCPLRLAPDRVSPHLRVLNWYESFRRRRNHKNVGSVEPYGEAVEHVAQPLGAGMNLNIFRLFQRWKQKGAGGTNNAPDVLPTTPPIPTKALEELVTDDLANVVSHEPVARGANDAGVRHRTHR